MQRIKQPSPETRDHVHAVAWNTDTGSGVQEINLSHLHFKESKQLLFSAHVWFY
jgi:hypothetical protein